MEGDDDDSQGGHLVKVGVFAQPLCILLDDLDVVFIVGGGCDVDGGSLGLEIGLGSRGGWFEGLRRSLEELVDVRVLEEVGDSRASQPLGGARREGMSNLLPGAVQTTC